MSRRFDNPFIITQTKEENKMARCKVCGKKIQAGHIICNDCTEAIRLKAMTAEVTETGNVVEDVSLDVVQAEVLAKQMAEKKGLFSTQDKIKDILGGMCDLLLYKNQKYGDSALKPKNVFYKGDATNSILIRLDDKIGRVTANPDDKPRVNDVADIIGYCVLLLISMGVTREDLAKFMD